eukprot:274513-Lingulodinium_polyedra.AAC.1
MMVIWEQRRAVALPVRSNHATRCMMDSRSCPRWATNMPHIAECAYWIPRTDRQTGGGAATAH